MKIVVLDGYTLNPGDLDWEPLEALGEVTVYERTAPEQVAERIEGAEIILTNKALVGGDVIRGSETLKYIGVLATGYNVVDIEAAKERGVVVTNAPGYGTPSVAQHVFALMLELASNVGLHSTSAKGGDWSACEDFCYWKRPLVELEGKTLGVVGLGAIGQAVASRGLAFGMRVVASTRTPKRIEGVELVEMDALFREADVVTLHCPLTNQTENLVDAKRLGTMKESAFLINTGRGALVDEEALASALEAGELAGAAVDVLSKEPPEADNPLLKAKNCVVTPHIAWASRAARRRLLDIVADNLQSFLNGDPKKVVS